MLNIIHTFFLCIYNFLQFFYKNTFYNRLKIYFRLFEKNPNIAYIYNSILVKCNCEKQIALHREYEEINLIKHLQNDCNLKNK